MAGFLQVKELEAKRKALAAESEVYRETMRLELHNLRLYSVQARRKLTNFRTNPLVVWGVPIVGSLLRARRRKTGRWRRYFPMALLAFPVLQKYLPSLLVRFAGGLLRAGGVPQGEEETPAATV